LCLWRFGDRWRDDGGSAFSEHQSVRKIFSKCDVDLDNYFPAICLFDIYKPEV
jgi:hypothetical protein